MIELFLASTIVSASPGMIQATPQTSTTQSASIESTALADIPVNGVRRRELIERFVTNVAAPIKGRQVARWKHNRPVCVSITNLQTEGAHYIADRIGDVARDLNLLVGAPGCRPNVHIIATRQTREASQWVRQERYRQFVPREFGASLGRAAFERFVSNDEPIKWWHTVAVKSAFGETTISLGDGLNDSADNHEASLTLASRILESFEDNLQSVLIIFDPARVADLNADQLADYLAFLVLAQVNPDAETEAYESVLNVIDHPTEVAGLTDWDHTYLRGLYRAARSQKNAGAARNEIISAIDRQQRMLTASEN